MKAYRVWDVVGEKLCPPYGVNGVALSRDGAAKATCWRQGHKPPVAKCSCGFYFLSCPLQMKQFALYRRFALSLGLGENAPAYAITEGIAEGAVLADPSRPFPVDEALVKAMTNGVGWTEMWRASGCRTTKIYTDSQQVAGYYRGIATAPLDAFFQ